MRKRNRQLLLVFSVILIFSGLILAASSSFYTTEEKDTFTDDANYAISRSSQKINLGTEITRFFNRGERLRPYFTPYIVSFYPDQIPPVNFTIVSPNNETTTISYDMSPVASEQGPIPTITNLTVSKIEGLQRTNSSSSKFEAATLESGNYTLILTSSYIELNYLALNKIVTIYHYPYANFLPVGATLMVVGTIFFVLSYSFKSSRKNRKKT